MTNFFCLIAMTLFFASFSDDAFSDINENNSYANSPNLLQINAAFKSENLGKNIAYLIDNDQSILIDQIISDKSFNWQTSTEVTPNFGVDPANFWFKRSIKFNGIKSDDYLIEVAYPALDFIDLYIFQNGRLIKTDQTGDRRAFNSRSVNHRNFLFLLPSLDVNQPVDIYIRAQTAGAMQLPLFLWEKQAFWEQDQFQVMAHTFFSAVLLTLALYNFMLFLSLRDTTYLLYVFYITCLVISQMGLRGLNYQLLVPEYPLVSEKMLLMSIGSAVFFACLFTRQFMALPRTNPLMNKILLSVAGIALIQTIGGQFIPYSLNLKLGILITAIACPLLLLSGLIQWLRGFKIARYFTLAWFLYLFGQFALTLSKFGIIPRTAWIEHGPELGAALEVILLSFALADRMNDERRKRYLAQENALLHEKAAREAQDHALTVQNQANEKLESRVSARTIELSEALEELSEVNEKLHALSTLDGLTQVGNRRAFDTMLDREWRRCMRDGVDLSLLLVDVDFFKQINDQYGHQTGDECLKLIASTLNDSVKRPADAVSRYGGEEFAIVLPNTPQHGAEIIAERIRASIEMKAFIYEEQKISLTISIGIACMIPTIDQKHSSLLEKADQALYRAKREGRNRVCTHC